MKKSSKTPRQEVRLTRPELTVGLDLGDRYSHYCVLDGDGDVIEQGRCATTEAGLRQRFARQPEMRIALEAGTHSAWSSRLLRELGHQPIVANPRKLRAITASDTKNDRNDAELLARLAAHDPRLLSPIRHRDVERQQDLDVIHARAALVRARTLLVNVLRGLVKSAGARLPLCSTRSFPQRAAGAVPPGLRPACQPLIQQVAELNLRIAEMDCQIAALGKKYPEISLLRSVPGVGPLVAACYVLTLDRPSARGDNRQAGAFLGLRPRQRQSGDSDPQHGIAKTGNRYLRSLLVQSAHYVLGRFGPDSALRRWGLKLAMSAGRRGKKRAVVAVARKLAVLLQAMWRQRTPFQPFPQPAATAAAVAA
jgi:transposase